MASPPLPLVTLRSRGSPGPRARRYHREGLANGPPMAFFNPFAHMEVQQPPVASYRDTHANRQGLRACRSRRATWVPDFLDR